MTGYLVTEDPQIGNSLGYYGVDNNPWPLGIELLEEWVPIICNKALNDLSFPLLVDFHTALRYYAMCTHAGKSPRLLYCVVITDRCESESSVSICSLPCTFLGFDYAYASGDYYSSVANDIIYENGYFSSQWKKHLNVYGLFSQVKKIKAFKKRRNALLRNGLGGNAIELGNFAIFGIYAIDNVPET